MWMKIPGIRSYFQLFYILLKLRHNQIVEILYFNITTLWYDNDI